MTGFFLKWSLRSLIYLAKWNTLAEWLRRFVSWFSFVYDVFDVRRLFSFGVVDYTFFSIV